jgi:hypothetical protein
MDLLILTKEQTKADTSPQVAVHAAARSGAHDQMSAELSWNDARPSCHQRRRDMPISMLTSEMSNVPPTSTMRTCRGRAYRGIIRSSASNRSSVEVSHAGSESSGSRNGSLYDGINSNVDGEFVRDRSRRDRGIEGSVPSSTSVALASKVRCASNFVGQSMHAPIFFNLDLLLLHNPCIEPYCIPQF